MNFAVAQAIIWFGNLFMILIIIRAVLSWFPMSRDGGFVAVIFSLVSLITEPFVSPIRRLIQRSPLGGGGMMIDISPMITMILMRVLTTSLANFIVTM